MDKIAFEKYLQERYVDQMNYYSNTAAKHQKKYKLFQWILIILSALTPVLAALSDITWVSGGNTHVIKLNILVVIVSSVVAILTTGLKTFNYQELWVNCRTTFEKLKPEIHYYDFSIGPYARAVDKQSLFVSRVEGILDSEHNQWPPALKLQENQAKNKESDSLNVSQTTITGE